MWRIRERLYLGDYDSGVSALSGVERETDPDGSLSPFFGVVSLCPMPLSPDDSPLAPHRDETEWLHIPIYDGGFGEEEFESALGVALPFIRRRRAEGNVLVHCAAGMSRSVSVIAAVLCEERDTSVEDALSEIAEAKATALAPLGYDAELLVAPAWEFRSALRRRYGPGRRR